MLPELPADLKERAAGIVYARIKTEVCDPTGCTVDVVDHMPWATDNNRKRLRGYGDVFKNKALLHYAVRAKLLDENPAAVVPNPEPKRSEVPTFTLDELDLVAGELLPRFRPIPVFAALTGLRPCEWMALERRDVDYQAGVVTVRRTVVDGAR